MLAHVIFLSPYRVSNPGIIPSRFSWLCATELLGRLPSYFELVRVYWDTTLWSLISGAFVQVRLHIYDSRKSTRYVRLSPVSEVSFEQDRNAIHNKCMIK